MKYEIGTGYQKQTGWISANDGFLVLDRNFNGSVDNATVPAWQVRTIEHRPTPEMISIHAIDTRVVGRFGLAKKKGANDMNWKATA